MSGIPILNPEQRWECPNCPAQEVTHEAQPHTRYHTCRGLKGLSAPMVPVGTRCQVVAREREDYVGSEIVTEDADGRPIMSVETLHEDGRNDVAVFAPLATLDGGEVH